MQRAESPRPRPVQNHTRERILAAARALFAEVGFDATSVRMIARSIGISDPAVHYYFPSKQSLYEALLVPPEYGTLPLDYLPLTRETMIDQIMHLFGWWASNVDFGRMLLQEQLALEPASVSFIRTCAAAWEEAVNGPLEQLTGELADDVSAMLFDLLSGLYWDAILSYGPHTSDTVNQDYFVRRVRRVVDLAIPGTRLDAG